MHLCAKPTTPRRPAAAAEAPLPGGGRTTVSENGREGGGAWERENERGEGRHQTPEPECRRAAPPPVAVGVVRVCNDDVDAAACSLLRAVLLYARHVCTYSHHRCIYTYCGRTRGKNGCSSRAQHVMDNDSLLQIDDVSLTANCDDRN